MIADPNCATVNRGETCEACRADCGAGRLLDDRRAAGALAYVLWLGYSYADITRALMSEERRQRAGALPFAVLGRSTLDEVVPAPPVDVAAPDSPPASRGVILTVSDDGTEVKVGAVGLTRDEAADLLESVLEDFDVDDAVADVLSESRQEEGSPHA